MLLLRQWPICSWVTALSPSPTKRIVGIASKGGTSWEQAVLCVSSQLQFWLESSFHKTCVQRERWPRWDGVGPSQKVSQDRASTPGVHGEQRTRTHGQAGWGRLPRASSQPSCPGLQTQGKETSLPTFPLTGLQHLVLWKRDSNFPFHPYNVLLKNKLYFGEFETFTKVKGLMSPHGFFIQLWHHF